MKKIIAFGGSNNSKSINKTLAIYAASKISDTAISVIDLNDFKLPLYSIDLEEELGIPEAVHQFNQMIESADGLVISLAEHNGTYTAVFKNLMDWLSRIDMKIWKGKPMLLMATSPGRRGGENVLTTAKSYFPFIEGNIVADFSLPSFYENFSNAGITNPALAEKLHKKIGLFEQSMDLVDTV